MMVNFLMDIFPPEKNFPDVNWFLTTFMNYPNPFPLIFQLISCPNLPMLPIHIEYQYLRTLQNVSNPHPFCSIATYSQVTLKKLSGRPMKQIKGTLEISGYNKEFPQRFVLNFLSR